MDLKQFATMTLNEESHEQSPNAKNHFLSLPAEIHLTIGGTCSRSDLQTMCLTSKSLNKLYTENLYEEVYLLQPALGLRLNTADLVINQTFHRQALFLKTIKAHPEYAKHVQRFEWTFMNKRREDARGWLEALPSYSASEPDGIWEILSTLSNVSQVKINEASIEFSWIKVPKHLTLFPRLKSVSIFGSVVARLVRAILPVRKASQLQSLRLENFHMFSIARQAVVETTGPFFAGLVGNCADLQSIEIIHGGDDFPYPCAVLGATCTVYASLIDSSRGTLEYLYYKRRYGNNIQFDSSMRVRQVLERGSWPCLRNAEVRPKLRGEKRTAEGEAETQ
ncbi:hypothetical protein G7Y79_00001g001000 [Physcia stellaris]|nr:hypothetical protein G7Y79_00001g001000 [Physcia stellaris]